MGAAGRAFGVPAQRNLVTVLTLGLAALIALFNREGRDLADLLSGTRVVRLR